LILDVEGVYGQMWLITIVIVETPKNLSVVAEIAGADRFLKP